jgi:hypothetical protein
MESINLEEKLASFDELWSPKIVARFNDHDVMVGKVKGEFVWHKHDETDDFFLVLRDGWPSSFATETSSWARGTCS